MSAYSKDRTVVRVAAAQISPVLDEPPGAPRTGTLDKVLATIATAAGDRAQLVCFPETFVPFYPYFSFIEPPFKIGRQHLDLYADAVVVPSNATR
ncbi:MAG: nitrilase-related carbon-nitrogen hydrolase, partial [Planctomycetota bacterium]